MPRDISVYKNETTPTKTKNCTLAEILPLNCTLCTWLAFPLVLHNWYDHEPEENGYESLRVAVLLGTNPLQSIFTVVTDEKAVAVPNAKIATNYEQSDRKSLK